MVDDISPWSRVRQYGSAEEGDTASRGEAIALAARTTSEVGRGLETSGDACRGTTGRLLSLCVGPIKGKVKGTMRS